MRPLFKVVVVGMMLIFAAGLIELYVAPFGWGIRVIATVIDFLSIYFGWLLLTISADLRIPTRTGSQLPGNQSVFEHRLVRRAIWVILLIAALIVLAILLGVVGIIN